MTKDKSDIEFNDELRYLELKQMIEKADNAVAVAVATTATTCAVPILLLMPPCWWRSKSF